MLVNNISILIIPLFLGAIAGIPLDSHDHFVDLVSCSLSPRISWFCGKNGLI